MNREIKFRCWDKEGKKMYQVENLNLASEGPKVDVISPCHEKWIDCPPGWEDGEEIYLMQFTGLLDKNGVEIYEGDVVKYDYGNPLKRNIPNPKIREVAFVDGMFCLLKDDYHYESRLNTPLNNKVEECEVIGNIHEHPNLLK